MNNNKITFTEDEDKDYDYSNFFKGLERYNEFDRYTTEGFKDDLFLQLCFTKEKVTTLYGNQITISKYYRQAWELLPRISLGNPPPYYIINLSDLTPKLSRELECDEANRDYIIKQAILRIYENINPRICHLVIARKLRWKVGP